MFVTIGQHPSRNINITYVLKEKKYLPINYLFLKFLINLLLFFIFKFYLKSSRTS